MVRGRSKVFSGYRTIVPVDIRRTSEIKEGDMLEWAIEEGTIVVRPRRRRTLDDITDLATTGSDAVADGRSLPGRERPRR